MCNKENMYGNARYIKGLLEDPEVNRLNIELHLDCRKFAGNVHPQRTSYRYHSPSSIKDPGRSTHHFESKQKHGLHKFPTGTAVHHCTTSCCIPQNWLRTRFLAQCSLYPLWLHPRTFARIHHHIFGSLQE
jgi:hypothetical protein